MAAVRGLRVSVKAEAPEGPALGLPSPEADSGLERSEPEPMEVEEGELEIVPVRRSLKELIPVRAGGRWARRRSLRERVPRAEAGRKGRWPAPGLGESRAKGKEGGERRGEGDARLEGRPGARERTLGRPEMGVEGAGGGGVEVEGS